jgi:hypothetical protein
VYSVQYTAYTPGVLLHSKQAGRRCSAPGAAAWECRRRPRPPRTGTATTTTGGRPCRSHCRFAQPFITFLPDSLRFLVYLFLKRQCDRALPTGYGWHTAVGAFFKLSSRNRFATQPFSRGHVSSSRRHVHRSIPITDPCSRHGPPSPGRRGRTGGRTTAAARTRCGSATCRCAAPARTNASSAHGVRRGASM